MGKQEARCDESDKGVAEGQAGRCLPASSFPSRPRRKIELLAAGLDDPQGVVVADDRLRMVAGVLGVRRDVATASSSPTSTIAPIFPPWMPTVRASAL